MLREPLGEDAEGSSLISRWGLFPSRLTPPVERPTDVARDELIDLLGGTSARLISVVAPAGYGKTTLLGQHVRALAGPFTWLRTGMDCNDRTTLAHYLSVALEQVTSIDRVVGGTRRGAAA